MFQIFSSLFSRNPPEAEMVRTKEVLRRPKRMTELLELEQNDRPGTSRRAIAEAIDEKLGISKEIRKKLMID